MVESIGMKLPDAIAARGRENIASDAVETRLEHCLAHANGHVLLTGPDRSELDALLDRVLSRLCPLGTVRVGVRHDGSWIDPVLALLDSGKEVAAHLEHEAVLRRLLSRAQEADRSVFIVVDDAEEASLEKLEELCSTLAVAPDAGDRLRLVFIGTDVLARKIDSLDAASLEVAIATRLNVGAGEVATPAAHALYVGPRARYSAKGLTWHFAVGAMLPVAVVVVATMYLATANSASRQARVISARGADVPSRFSAAVEGEAQSLALPSRGLRGDEPFLRSPLRIPVNPEWVTGSALYPAAPAAEAPDVAHRSEVQRRPPEAAAPAPTGAKSSSAAPKRSDPAVGTSISSFLERFGSVD